MQGAVRNLVFHTAFHTMKVQHYSDSRSVWCSSSWSTSKALYPAPARQAELIRHCICILCPVLHINKQFRLTSVENWILQALLPHVFQSLLEGGRERETEI